MNVILPEVSFPSGEKWAVKLANKGDPQAFMKFLMETANPIVPHSQEELTSDYDETVNPFSQTAFIESGVNIVCIAEEEIMAENVSLEETNDPLYTGHLGISMVAEPSVEITQSTMVEGEISAITLSEMPEPETNESSTLTTEITVERDFSGKVAQTKAELGETESAHIKLPDEEEQGKAKDKGRERSTQPFFGDKQNAVQDESKGLNLSVTKVVEAHIGKSGFVQDQLKKDALQQEQSAAEVYAGTQFFVGPEHGLKGTVAAAGLEPKVIGPIIEELQFQHTLKDGVGEIRIRLQPESLGEVVIKVSRADGRVSGRILVDNFMVKEVLENRLSFLKDRLHEMGIELTEMQVSLGNTPDQESGTGLPAKKSWSVRGLGGKEKDPVVRENAIHATWGVLDIFA